MSQTVPNNIVEAFVSDLESRLAGWRTEGEAWIACAPGTLDVMGGIAEYSGSLTLSTPVQCGVQVAVSMRDDQRVRFVRLSAGGSAHVGNGQPVDVEWPLASFYGAGEAPATPDVMRAPVAALNCRSLAASAAAVHALLASGVAPHLGGGFTIVLASTIPGAVDSRHVAAIEAATLTAITRALQLDVERQRLAQLSRVAHETVLQWPVGIATHAAPLLAAPGRLLQIGCRPFEVGDTLEMPRGVTLVGIDCGKQRPDADAKYIQARTAALMGAEIVRRLLEVEGGLAPWEGYLARVSVTDYVDRLRDRLPTKLKGAAYLERFGPLSAALAEIEPNVVYKVRSRAEHHIYEDDRVRQFAERLTRAARTGDPRALAEAGELMYASHWSYGQRCGLGGIETDLLVNLLRGEGAEQGVMGCRISGQGAGGTVVALVRDSAEATSAVQRVVNTYRERTGNDAVVQTLADRGAVGVAVERLG